MTQRTLEKLNDTIKAGAEFLYCVSFGRAVQRNPLQAIHRNGQVYLVFVQRNGSLTRRKLTSCRVATDTEAGRVAAALVGG